MEKKIAVRFRDGIRSYPGIFRGFGGIVLVGGFVCIFIVVTARYDGSGVRPVIAEDVEIISPLYEVAGIVHHVSAVDDEIVPVLEYAVHFRHNVERLHVRLGGRALDVREKQYFERRVFVGRGGEGIYLAPIPFRGVSRAVRIRRSRLESRKLHGVSLKLHMHERCENAEIDICCGRRVSFRSSVHRYGFRFIECLTLNILDLGSLYFF